MTNQDNTQDKLNIQPIDKLLEWDKSKILLLKTDTLGKIEYVNQAFLDVSGYESIDLLDKPFDIIRHPDMTVTVQKWVVLEIMQGIEANVIVKCLAKSGKYFWALLDYKINMKADGGIENVTIKFQSLDMSVVNNHIIPLYRQLFIIEKNKGLDAGKKYLRGFLEERNRTFDEFTRNLINTGRDSFNDNKSNFFKRLFGLS
jgi:PAS domain S-box-containing protein